MVLREFSLVLDQAGCPLCRSAGGPPPCMFASPTGRPRPPCGRVPGPNDGDGITVRHRFRYYNCRGLALKSGITVID
jgi:hypothetical protein